MKLWTVRKLVFLLVLVLPLAVPSDSQNTSGNATTTGKCSPAISGNNNQVKIKCEGMTKEQAAKMSVILNKILANQLDPEAVMAKLDEILHAVNPNIPAKTYFCNGTWRSAGPGKNAALEVVMGGDDAAFQEMARLNDSKRYDELLAKCRAQIQSTPEWLTPRLFCALAYVAKDDAASAKQMLKEFDAKSGPAYQSGGCEKMSNFLRLTLQ